MILVDTHCHLDMLDLSPYDGDLSKAFAHANSMDVKYFLNVCVALEDFPKVLKIANQYPNVYASVGLHPNEQVTHEPTVEEIIKLSQDEKVIAIGETGLDTYRSTGDLTWQQNRFRNHIRAAIKTKKPLIIHTRQAKEDTVKIMQEENAKEAGGIMHCFTEDWEMAQKCLDLGFYISFSGIVTFPNAKVIQEVAQKVPLDRMLLETDSPYLAPIPHRGKSNEPAFVRHTADFIAKLRGVSLDEIAEKTTQNFSHLFKI